MVSVNQKNFAKLSDLQRPAPTCTLQISVTVNGNTSLNTDEYGALFSPYSVVFHSVQCSGITSVAQTVYFAVNCFSFAKRFINGLV